MSSFSQPAAEDNEVFNVQTETAFVTTEESSTEQLLWRVVIARTIQDWLSAPLRAKSEAEGYLFENSADLSLVCGLAGISVKHMRACLDKVRGRTLLDLLPAAEGNPPSLHEATSSH